MKMRNWVLGSGIILAILAMAAGSLRAQEVTNVFSIAAVANVQGETNETDSVVVVQEPTLSQIATLDLMNLLAEDLRAEGSLPSTNLPAGAALAVITTGPGTGGDTADFQVLDQNDRFLFSVSNILSMTLGTNIVSSGSIDKSTGLFQPTLTGQFILTFEYNDLAIHGGAGIRFILSGLATRTITDFQPNTMGELLESRASSMLNGQGTGTFQDSPLVISGSITLIGQTTLVVERSAATPTFIPPTAATPAVPTMTVPTNTIPITTALPETAPTNPPTGVGTNTTGSPFFISGGNAFTNAIVSPGTNSAIIP
jgi:hypothetical protein